VKEKILKKKKKKGHLYTENNIAI